MKIHEYQGKAVLAAFGVPVPQGKVAYTVAEAVEIAKELGFPVVVKAQIHAGGRGKGGGVKLARTAEEAETIAKAMLGMTLQTHQTGPEGRVVRRLLIEQGVDLAGAKEMYLAIVVDRARGGAGVHGLDARAAWTSRRWRPRTPTAILKEAVDPARRLPGLPGPQAGLRPGPARGGRAQGRGLHAGPLPRLRGRSTPRSSRSTPSC